MTDILEVKICETDNEWREIEKLIAKKYLNEFGVRPSPAGHHVIVLRNGVIVGTSGLEFSCNEGIPLERYFDIDDEWFMGVFKPDIVELTRWASCYPNAGLASHLGITRYALGHNKVFAVLSLKEKQLQHLELFGSKLTALSATVKKDIPDFLKKYYLNWPRPKLFRTYLKELYNISRQAVLKLKEQGIIIRINF